MRARVQKSTEKGESAHTPSEKSYFPWMKKVSNTREKTYSNQLKMASKKLQNKAANLRKKEHVETKRKKQKASKNGKGNRKMQSIKK